MRITREVDGLKFIGECAPERGFVAVDIQCAHCGRRIDPKTDGRDVSLDCLGCGMRPKVFWSEADMHVFLYGELELAAPDLHSSHSHDAAVKVSRFNWPRPLPCKREPVFGCLREPMLKIVHGVTQ